LKESTSKRLRISRRDMSRRKVKRIMKIKIIVLRNKKSHSLERCSKRLQGFAVLLAWKKLILIYFNSLNRNSKRSNSNLIDTIPVDPQSTIIWKLYQA